MKIACIGSGNMRSALMRGAAKVVGGSNITFTDSDPQKAQAAAQAVGGMFCDSNSVAMSESDFVFLAVKPQVISDVLKEISSVVSERYISSNPVILVSMAAGWAIEKIQGCLNFDGDKKNPVVRIMPNTPSLIGQGVIAMSSSPEVSAEKIRELEEMLSACGIVDVIDERYLNAVSGLSGAGPAYVYLFIEALADAGVRAGLSREKALMYAAQTVLGSAALLKETGEHPAKLKDMVTSPGGLTIEGVAALENGAFRGTVMNAVKASCEKAKLLG